MRLYSALPSNSQRKSHAKAAARYLIDENCLAVGINRPICLNAVIVRMRAGRKIEMISLISAPVTPGSVRSRWESDYFEIPALWVNLPRRNSCARLATMRSPVFIAKFVNTIPTPRSDFGK